MAEYLAFILETEKDKVNCLFVFKIRTSRHKDRCSGFKINPFSAKP